MAPNLIGNTFLLSEATIQPENTATKRSSVTCPSQVPSSSFTNQQKVTKNDLEVQEANTKKEYQLEIVWRNVIIFSLLHLAALYGAYIVFAENAYLEYIWAHFIGIFGGFGITAGAHRLWAHRSYKAKWPLRVFLMLCQSLAFQNSIHEWVRDHRVHHKFTDTHADPHNSKRGFFFSHVGWLLCKKHPDVRTKGATVDMSDLEADPIVMFQKRHYFTIMPLCCFVFPALVPYFYMGASMRVCFFVCSLLRYVLSLHFTWLVNSAAHIWGMKPYDKSISPTNNKVVAFLANGEGWHNYHHVFPWDYKTAELGSYMYNLSTALIDFFAKIGWAYDLKTVSEDMIRTRVCRTGDGSHKVIEEINNNKSTDELFLNLNHENEETMIWGWDDKDMRDDDKKNACIINKAD